jgi:hypothetical protein
MSQPPFRAAQQYCLLCEHKKSPGTFAGADNQIKLSVKFFFISELLQRITAGCATSARTGE